MNFLAHHLLASQFLTSPETQAAYTVGTALPDLLPLADPHKRLRPTTLSQALRSTPDEHAVTEGVRIHLVTDAVFHKTPAFHEAQTRVGEAITQAGFVGIRVRRFFLAHVLTELALDAVLLRRQPHLVSDFYQWFAAADLGMVAHWAEAVVSQLLPALPGVLTHFADARYLHSYATDAGVAEGLRRLSLRARQDAIQGDNARRLLDTVTAVITILEDRAVPLLAETAAAVNSELFG